MEKGDSRILRKRYNQFGVWGLEFGVVTGLKQPQTPNPKLQTNVYSRFYETNSSFSYPGL